MRALSAAVIVLAGAVCISAEIQTAHLHPDRWGLIGLPLMAIGLFVWTIAILSRDSGSSSTR